MSGDSLTFVKTTSGTPTTLFTATDSFNSTATKHGIRNEAGANELDDWFFTGAGPGVLIAITAPVQFQVFQRTGQDDFGIGGTGSILISGTNDDSSAHDIEASFNGGSYATIASSAAGSSPFSGTLTGQAAGGGTLSVRFADDHTQTATVDDIGVGEVFVLAGQSNVSGGSASLYDYSSVNGLKSGLFITDWADETTGGAVWNFVATNALSCLRCPIAFLLVEHGGTNIDQWTPAEGSGYYEEITGAPTAAGTNGLRAVLWWQGEGDSDGTTQAAYYAALSDIADGVLADLGVKLMPCKLQLLNPANASTQDQIWAAVEQVWLLASAAIGADLDDIECEPEDTVHLTTLPKLAAAAARWWTAMNNEYFSPAATPGGEGIGRIGLTGGILG